MNNVDRSEKRSFFETNEKYDRSWTFEKLSVFYWKNVFFVQWENKRDRWKINDNFENKQYQFVFLDDWKTNEMGRWQMMNERNEKKAERAHLYL